ncbi:MAG: hypothetical protein ACKVT0_14670, partial [Planctomycetaceae bacterium]
SEPARLRPAVNGSWPDVQAGRLNAIVITFVAGYTDLVDEEEAPIAAKDQRKAVPDLAKQLILQHIGAAYEGAEGRPSADYLAALDHDVTPLLWTW